ncbi:MAG: amino acid ABC transporter permease [Lachnospiraceae bacterium]|nr:amino acid ABC transporter permease [Lachnospiraceae bacterium]
MGSRSLAERLYDDFISQNRYMYLVKGLGNTVLITVFALLIGVIIGVVVALIRVSYQKNKKRGPLLIIGNFISGLYLTVIRGTPMVVQLMIMYFVIWASGKPIMIAIVSFGLNSGAYVAEVIRSGIQSVDRGQTEAGRSLGLSSRQTMIYIILPQAFKNVAPAIFNEFIVLLKETSVAGYVGIQDLTKGGDIIRSITYDAFPPLIVVAAIYLVMVIFLTQILHVIEGRLAQSDLR